jgi:ABC-type uncharacterized transport system permease subunit
MEDPFSPPVMAKIIAGFGGFIGGATFMAFYKPNNVWDAAVRSCVCTTTAIVGVAPLLSYLNLQMNSDHIIAAAAFIGFCSWSTLSLFARFLLKIQDEKTEIKLPDFIQTKK